MEQTNGKFTIFFGESWASCNVNLFAKCDLAGLIHEWSHMVPVAWAAEYPDSFGGTKTQDELRDESIAAGRLIRSVGGKYVPIQPAAPRSAYFQQQLSDRELWESIKSAADPVKEAVSTALPPIAGLSFLPDVAKHSHQVNPGGVVRFGSADLL
jgi:hypothetical protein